MSHQGLDLTEVVRQLREQRDRRPADGRSCLKPMPLPSRQVLSALIDDLAAALFPQRLALPSIRQPGEALPQDSTDYFVGHTLDTCLRSLYDQIRIELAARAVRAGNEAEMDDSTGDPGDARTSRISVRNSSDGRPMTSHEHSPRSCRLSDSCWIPIWTQPIGEIRLH